MDTSSAIRYAEASRRGRCLELFGVDLKELPSETLENIRCVVAGEKDQTESKLANHTKTNHKGEVIPESEYLDWRRRKVRAVKACDEKLRWINTEIQSRRTTITVCEPKGEEQ